MVKNKPANAGDARDLEEEVATHSSTLAWEILWTEGPGGLQSMGSQRVEHSWATKHTHMVLVLLDVIFMFNIFPQFNTVIVFDYSAHCHRVFWYLMFLKFLFFSSTSGCCQILLLLFHWCLLYFSPCQFSSVQSLSRVQLFATP